MSKPYCCRLPEVIALIARLRSTPRLRARKAMAQLETDIAFAARKALAQ